MNIDNKNEYLTKTGLWWCDPWWESDCWFNNTNFSKSDFLASIEFLKKFFPPEWVKLLGDDPFKHPFIRFVNIGQGTHQIAFLYSFSLRLQSLETVAGFSSVLDSYKSLSEVISADLELFIAYVLTKAYQDVSFIRAKSKRGKTPDISAYFDGAEFVVECKSIRDSEAEVWVDNYASCYSKLILDAKPDNFEIIFQENLSHIDPDEYGYPLLGSYKVAASIDARPIIELLKEFKGEPKYIDMGHLGQLLIISSDCGVNSSVTIPSISQSFIGRRLVGNAIRKANRQIKEHGKPGVVAISYQTPPDAGNMQLMLPKIFNQHTEEYKYLMGVLVFPAQNILKYIKPIWIENPYSLFNAIDYGLPKTLKDSLNPIGG